MTLLERVPLRDLGAVTQTDCDAIVDRFLVEHADEVEQAIKKVEAEQVEGARLWADGVRTVDDVADGLIETLLRFARKGRTFLDRPLSPYL